MRRIRRISRIEYCRRHSPLQGYNSRTSENKELETYGIPHAEIQRARAHPLHSPAGRDGGGPHDGLDEPSVPCHDAAHQERRCFGPAAARSYGTRALPAETSSGSCRCATIATAIRCWPHRSRRPALRAIRGYAPASTESWRKERRGPVAGDGSICFTEAVMQGCRWLRREGEGQPTMLLDGRADVELARRVAADAGLSFGIRFETLDSLAASYLGSFGRRQAHRGRFRAPASGARVAFPGRMGGCSLPAGLCALVASIAAEGLLPPLATEAPTATDDRLSPNELMALRAAGDYRKELAERGLADMSEALSAMAADERYPLRVAVVGGFRTTAAQQAALDALRLRCAFEAFPYGFAELLALPAACARAAAGAPAHLRHRGHSPRRADGSRVRFLLPAGAYATSQLVSEQIADYLRGLETVAHSRPLVVVAAKRPR